jgi:hypothetical protein
MKRNQKIFRYLVLWDEYDKDGVKIGSCTGVYVTKGYKIKGINNMNKLSKMLIRNSTNEHIVYVRILGLVQL